VKEQTPELCLAALKINGWTLEYINDKTIELCREAIKQNKGEFVPKHMRNQLACLMITDICIAFRPLRLASYVILWIIDWVLLPNTMKEIMKINQIIRINEKRFL
jgi:hypothetical protein